MAPRFGFGIGNSISKGCFCPEKMGSDQRCPRKARLALQVRIPVSTTVVLPSETMLLAAPHQKVSAMFETVIILMGFSVAFATVLGVARPMRIRNPYYI
jgi:hypothetical protein